MLAEALELYRREPKPIYRALLLNTYENKQDWENFTSTAEEGARLQPDDPESWQLLAKGQGRLKKNKEAAQSLWRAAETAGRRVDLWLAAGAAFSGLGQTGPSRQAYEKALQLDPDNKPALQALSRLKNPAAPPQAAEGGHANSD
jgi:cytochrome c-type biogenesis protein CcmH/NrfG